MFDWLVIPQFAGVRCLNAFRCHACGELGNEKLAGAANPRP